MIRGFLLLLAVASSLTTGVGAAGLPNAWQITDVSDVSGSGSLNFTYALTPAQRVAATNSGWHYTLVSRLVSGSANSTPAHFMVYGNGVKRFDVSWDLNTAGQLVAILGGTPNLTNILTEAGSAATDYHTHALIYDPATSQATYLFDGSPVASWLGLNDAVQTGIVQWGSASSDGQGRMNYHRVRFSIEGLGVVSEYFAGFEGDPAVAPSPTDQNWNLIVSAAPNAVTHTPVSPDNVVAPCQAIVFVDSEWVGTPWGTDPDGDGPATRFGWDAFATYEDAQQAICENGTIQVVGNEIEIVGLEPEGENAVRVVFEDLAGVGQGPGCLYTLQSASEMSVSTTWSYLQTVELQHLGNGRHQFLAPKEIGPQRYYRIVVWTPGSTDTDHDGLADTLEIALGTDPNKFDTDGDGFNDCLEITLHTNPLDPNSLPPASAFAQAEFASAETVVLEGTSVLRIGVRFNRPFIGDLRYNVDTNSSASAADFTDLSGGRVSVNGTNAEIRLQLKEDFEVESVETIAISLLQNTNTFYRRGSRFSHSVVIVDNDALYAGTLISGGMVSRFGLKVLRSGNTNEAWLLPAAAGERFLGTIPSPPSNQPGWAITNWLFTADRLRATTVPIPLGKTLLFGEQSLQRVIDLSAVPPASTNNAYLFTNAVVRGLDIGPVVIGGHYTDTVLSSGVAVGTIGKLQGIFQLTRETPTPGVVRNEFVNP
ncbi:MAG: hypothetical protein JNN07_11550 [Verrucomicrobiales bacterium]|nr:hypothetical protein [Verrucomicrobiales bacterium]